MRSVVTIAMVLAGAIVPAGAEAHVFGAAAGGFVPGVVHFLSGPDHVALALVLGLMAGWSLAIRRFGVSLGIGAAALAVGFYAALEAAPGMEFWAFFGGVLFATALTAACGAGIFRVIYRKAPTPT